MNKLFLTKIWKYGFPALVFLLVAVTYKVVTSDTDVVGIPVNVVFGGVALLLWVYTIAVNEVK
jgi:hypothetical protein